MIPEAAVEAAVIAAHGSPRKDNKTLHKAMRLILEAAAPHIAISSEELLAVEVMVKDAYERGWGAGFRHASAAMRSTP